MKKTLRRKILPLFVGAIFICAFASSAGAYSFSYTDMDTHITYNLVIEEELTKGTHTATFSIDVGDTASDLSRVGWVAFHFGSKDVEIIDDDNLTVPGNWKIGKDDDGLAWGGEGNKKDIKPFKKNWVGFYSGDVLAGEGEPGGTELAPGNSQTFTFTMLGLNMPSTEEMSSGEWPFEEISLKVGSYGGPAGNSGRNQTAQLSESIPEPGTLLLLGSGFLGLALLGRRRARTKT